MIFSEAARQRRTSGAQQNEGEPLEKENEVELRA
jgi:hypothetical protein